MLKQTSFLAGLSLIAFSSYVLLMKTSLQVFTNQPIATLFLIIGIVFLLMGYLKKGHSVYIAPSILVVGLSLYFILKEKVAILPDIYPYSLLILALALLIQTVHSKGSFIAPLIVTVTALVTLFFQSIVKVFPMIGQVSDWWVFIVAGIGVLLIWLRS